MTIFMALVLGVSAMAQPLSPPEILNLKISQLPLTPKEIQFAQKFGPPGKLPEETTLGDIAGFLRWAWPKSPEATINKIDFVLKSYGLQRRMSPGELEYFRAHGAIEAGVTRLTSISKIGLSQRAHQRLVDYGILVVGDTDKFSLEELSDRFLLIDKDIIELDLAFSQIGFPLYRAKHERLAQRRDIPVTENEVGILGRKILNCNFSAGLLGALTKRIKRQKYIYDYTVEDLVSSEIRTNRFTEKLSVELNQFLQEHGLQLNMSTQDIADFKASPCWRSLK